MHDDAGPRRRYVFSMRMLRLLLAVVTIGSCTGRLSDDVDGDGSTALEDRLRTLGAVPCADAADFWCLSLSVPLDHGQPAGATTTVLFAVRPADGPVDEQLGPFVTVEGGPGYGGVFTASDYVDLHPEIAARFDLVFFDLRGLAGSGDIQCEAATAAFYAGGLRAADDDDDAAIAARAEAFGRACVDEIGQPESTIAAYTTAQGIDDMEAFRLAIGAPQLTMFGMSYGTQFTQLYAQKYPSSLRAIVLDGVVDMTLFDVAFARDLVRADNALLDRTLAWCDDDDQCRAGVGGDANTAFNTFAASLPVEVLFTTTTGQDVRTFSRNDLDSVAIATMDNPEGRRAFLEALASAVDDDVEPMLTLFYDYDGVDPDSLTSIPEEGWSDAGYYTFTCNDYGRADADGWLAELVDVRSDPDVRLLASFPSNLPCAFWPTAPALQPLPPRFLAPVPTLFVNADGDVATPFEQGDGMFKALVNDGAPVAAVTVSGGHHVMVNVGDACVDAVVSAFLFDPAGVADGTEHACAGDLVEP
jgi:pimeloyl-ACP methyl ester carboxylesterase